MSNMSKDKSDKYQKKRESAETSRVGMKWDHDEDERLLSAAKSKMPLDEIARSHCREVGGIATRLYHHAVKMMDDENEKNNISKVAEILNLSVEDIQKHIATKEKRREYMQNKSKTEEKNEKDDKKYDKNETEINENNEMKGDNIISLLTEIRDLLAIIAKK